MWSSESEVPVGSEGWRTNTTDRDFGSPPSVRESGSAGSIPGIMNACHLEWQEALNMSRRGAATKHSYWAQEPVSTGQYSFKLLYIYIKLDHPGPLSHWIQPDLFRHGGHVMIN